MSVAAATRNAGATLSEDLMKVVRRESVLDHLDFSSKMLALADEEYEVLVARKDALVGERDEIVSTFNVAIKEVSGALARVNGVRVKLDPSRAPVKAKAVKAKGKSHTSISEKRLSELTALIKEHFTPDQDFTTSDIRVLVPGIAVSAISVAVTELRNREVIRHCGKSGNTIIYRRY